MRRIQQWFGRVTIGVGLLGVVLALATLVVLWRVQAGFSDRAGEIADFAMDVNDNAKDRIAQADAVLEQMQNRVDFLERTAEQLRIDAEQNRTAVSKLHHLEADVTRGLEDARSLLVSIQSSMQTLSQALVLFESVSSPLRRVQRPAEPDTGADRPQLSRLLLETSEQLATVTEFVSLMEQQTISTALVTKLKQSIAKLERRIREVRAWLDSIQGYLHATGKRVSAARDRLLLWADVAAVTGTLLLVCFIFTQVHLVAYGRSLVLRGSGQPAQDRGPE